jgi:LPXTG-motif cell wall-anchored protein
MANPNQNKGVTGLGLLALGAAAYGAWKWRKNERAKGTYDGDGDGLSDTTGKPTATAKDIDVGTTAQAAG